METAVFKGHHHCCPRKPLQGDVSERLTPNLQLPCDGGEVAEAAWERRAGPGLTPDEHRASWVCDVGEQAHCRHWQCGLGPPAAASPELARRPHPTLTQSLAAFTLERRCSACPASELATQPSFHSPGRGAGQDGSQPQMHITITGPVKIISTFGLTTGLSNLGP